MNIHLPAILMFTRGTRFWHTAISCHIYVEHLLNLLIAGVAYHHCIMAPSRLRGSGGSLAFSTALFAATRLPGFTTLQGPTPKTDQKILDLIMKLYICTYIILYIYIYNIYIYMFIYLYSIQQYRTITSPKLFGTSTSQPFGDSEVLQGPPILSKEA